MQIQLRQPEIEQALKQYISQQGFNLVEKSVQISFTAGRKESGTSADITIEDVGSGFVLPQADGAEGDAAAAPVLTVVSNTVPEEGTRETTEETPKAAAPSLFGN